MPSPTKLRGFDMRPVSGQYQARGPRHADLILIMDQGGIVEHGTHDELLAQGGIYRAQVAAQIEINKGIRSES